MLQPTGMCSLHFKPPCLFPVELSRNVFLGYCKKLKHCVAQWPKLFHYKVHFHRFLFCMCLFCFLSGKVTLRTGSFKGNWATIFHSNETIQ